MKDNLELTGNIIFQKKIYSNRDVKQNIEKYKKVLLQNIDNSSKKIPIIGIYLERSPEMIFVILALFEMKITFLMLDVNLPFKRTEWMLENADVSILVSSKQNVSLFPYKKVICFDENEDEDSTALKSELEVMDAHNDLAYVLFTSGSTGNPKAVMVKRKGLINFIGSVPGIILMNKKSIVGCFTNCVFDIFFLETIAALYSGATVILGDEDTISNPIKLIKLIKDAEVNLLQFTPSRLRMIQMIDRNFSCLKDVKTLLVGGEVLTENLLITLQNNTNMNTKIFNMYGPTETTIWSTISDVTYANIVDIGEPIANTQIYIIDKNALFLRKNEIPVVEQGTVGEICIAGDGLSKGFLNNPEQTEKSFFDVLVNGVLTKIYRTGDLGYYREDGKLVCIGRKDDQIKLNGHRIELGEIESNLLKDPEILNVAVCLDKTYNKLVAFVILNYTQDVCKNSIIAKEIYNGLKEKFTTKLMENLPRYMCPSEYVFVDKLIYTSSGKLDRNALIDVYHLQKENKKEVLNESQSDEVLEKIITVISNTLGRSVSDISKKSELNMISINSIQFINIIVTCEELFDIEFEDTYLSLAKYNTIGDIYDYIIKLMDK